MLKKALPKRRDLCPMCGRRLAFAHYYKPPIRITRGDNRGTWPWEFAHEVETKEWEGNPIQAYTVCYGTEEDALRSDVVSG